MADESSTSLGVYLEALMKATRREILSAQIQGQKIREKELTAAWDYLGHFSLLEQEFPAMLDEAQNSNQSIFIQTKTGSKYPHLQIRKNSKNSINILKSSILMIKSIICAL